MNEKISVIVPVYNVGDYIERCIDSILSQTYLFFDLILVDDGSTDNSGIICDEYLDVDKRIKVIHKENGGLSDARNAGLNWALKHSDSKWITFVDSDDWIHPDYLLFLYKAVYESGLSISCCDYYRETSYKDFEKYDFSFVSENVENFFVNRRITSVIACSKLFKKTDLSLIRFPFGKLHEDEFTTYKILFKHKMIAYINLPLYFYYSNPESITQSKWTYNRLASLEAFQHQINFFKNHGFRIAYFSSAKALLVSSAKAYEKLRLYYPKEYLLRLQTLIKYYYCKIHFWGRLLSKREKKQIRKNIYPRLAMFCQWLMKKKSNIFQ